MVHQVEQVTREAVAAQGKIAETSTRRMQEFPGLCTRSQQSIRLRIDPPRRRSSRYRRVSYILGSICIRLPLFSTNLFEQEPHLWSLPQQRLLMHMVATRTILVLSGIEPLIKLCQSRRPRHNLRLPSISLCTPPSTPIRTDRECNSETISYCKPLERASSEKSSLEYTRKGM